ncbi:MAG: fibronectin type III domain-containing protein [Treponema sp.]|nr:fibronectin type III domain-containing protein [Treponema sp.]
MKNVFVSIFTLYIFLIVSGSLAAIDERTISLGGESTWKFAEIRNGVTEIKAVRPYPVLALASVSGASSAGYSAATGVLGNFSEMTQSAFDLFVSFDERQTSLFRDSAGQYILTIPSALQAADRAYARGGSGAAIFGNSGAHTPLIIKPYSRNALFSSGGRLRDFTIEFWLYPLNMENGEQIFSWVAVKAVSGKQAAQRILCSVSKNRLSWSFLNFFTSTNGDAHIDIELTGNKPVIPKTWSHHLIRFDAATGLLEYLVNGTCEIIAYATKTARESSEVYTPVIGDNGCFLLGEKFTGLMDELKIHSVCAGRSSVQKFPIGGGRMETGAVDLGHKSSGVVRIDAAGGKTGINKQNEYRENGMFRFSDDSQMHFFIRCSDNPWLLNNSRWVSFIPGSPVSGITGRYVQIAVDFYPSSDGETAPYLEKLNIIYMPGEPPAPVRNLSAVASDGAVSLKWRHSTSANTQGYLIYYSAVRGELFGKDAALGSSPIDVGMANNVLLEGLKNGTLYYFRVAAYDSEIGEFSSEVTARPLAGLQ